MMKAVIDKLKYSALVLSQRFIITLQVYFENGLSNHAAACAYGFLLSLAPMLVMIAFFIIYAFRVSPGLVAALIGTIPFMSNIFNEEMFTSDLFFFSNPGILSIFFALSVIWSCRILSLAIQRGLRNVFPSEEKRNRLKNTMLLVVVEVSVLFFVLIVIVSSRTALRFYELLGFLPKIPIVQLIATNFGIKFISTILFGIASFFVYLLIPFKPPRKSSAFKGALFCTLAYLITVFILGIVLNRTRYNFLYGTIGNLIIILINVYFFFTFFFIGAQLAFVLDFFDILLFSRLIKYKKMVSVKRKPAAYYLLIKFLSFSETRLNAFIRNFKKDEVVFSYINTMNDIFYILEGEVEILILSSDGNEEFAGILKADSIFSETDYILSRNQSVIVRAKTDVSLFMIPHNMLDAILKHDTKTDSVLISHIFNRYKKSKRKAV